MAQWLRGSSSNQEVLNVRSSTGELRDSNQFIIHTPRLVYHAKQSFGVILMTKVISASTSQDTENLNTAPPPAKRKLDDYFTKTKSDDDNLDDVLARMIALDGFPFSVFITSDNLRKLLLAKYTDLPKSAVTIQNAL
ncbi:hypothetical protein EVAR_51241_1 [Eumeta japonica]|uniref:Uncharacterized protein n=1 Tax=Eumeta variegata TaxID=151549 RepID=A0A4C1X505_EUMVA|nr:hypothetical protein EVAR_51241_1 [Eumeta japonica]